MIERMAQHKLEEEMATLRRVRRCYRASLRSRRSPDVRYAMTLAS